MIGTIDGIVWEDGNLYITNRASLLTNGVLEYDAAGNFVRVFASDPSLGNPVGLVFCDPGMASAAHRLPSGDKGGTVSLVSPLNQPDGGVLAASTADAGSSLTESRPQLVLESPAAPAASVTEGGEKLVGHQPSRDSSSAGLDNAAWLASRLRVSITFLT